MIAPARLAVSAETGTRISARQVSRQFSQIAMERQEMIRNGSRITLLNKRVQPLRDRIHVVGEAGDQLRRALVAEAREVERHGASEEVIANVEQRQLHQAGDEDFLKEEEQSLQGDAKHHEEKQEHERLESLVREVAFDPRLCPAVPRHPPCGVRFFLVQRAAAR